MVLISKTEAAEIRKLFPDTHIHRTVHKYYVEENSRVMNFLKKKNRKNKER